jgi:hypothetical protein
MANNSRTVSHAEWVPRSRATAPTAFPPHPPLRSGGWYHASMTETAGPGRPPAAGRTRRSVGVAGVLGVLFGPLGLCYLSLALGLTATAVTAVVVGYAGLPSLLVLWPLSILAAVKLSSRQD